MAIVAEMIKMNSDDISPDFEDDEDGDDDDDDDYGDAPRDFLDDEAESGGGWHGQPISFSKELKSEFQNRRLLILRLPLPTFPLFLNCQLLEREKIRTLPAISVLILYDQNIACANSSALPMLGKYFQSSHTFDESNFFWRHVIKGKSFDWS